MTSNQRVALGFAPHSGWTVVVGIGSGQPQVRVVTRERFEMADARDPESKQPYHAVEGLEVGEAARRLAAFEATAERMAHQAIQRIADRLAQTGQRVIGVGILDSAGRIGSSLATTLASHALIHTADGEHFRKAIDAAAARCGLPATRVRARELEARAVAAIGSRPATLQDALKELGRAVGPPWRADQKAAALLAWLVLAQKPRVRNDA